MTPTLISVTNQSSRVSDDDVEKMVKAVGVQLSRDVTPTYGLTPAIEFVRKGGSPSPNGCPCVVSDESDVDGALGYHDEDDNGVPYIKVFANPVLDNGGSVSKSALSLSATLSHEVLELLGDPAANRWADGPNNLDYAWELCDAVEGDSYEIGGIAVSNFVFPTFFDPRVEAVARLDFLDKLRAPFSMSPGGYQITRSEPGRVAQIFGAVAHHEIAPGLAVHFGSAFATWRRQAKIERAKARRGKRLVTPEVREWRG
jgi:hypothetical protein